MNGALVLDSVIDAYGISLAFYIYNVFWDILVNTGLAYVPFLILIGSAVHKVYESSMQDQDTRSSLRTVSTGLFLMVIALELAVYPMIPLTIHDIQYSPKSCQPFGGGRVDTQPTSNTHGASKTVQESYQIQLENRDIRAPILMYLAIQITQGVKNWAVEDLPCTTDFRMISNVIQQEKVANSALAQELKEFLAQCFHPAKKKFVLANQSQLPPSQDWPGGKVFLVNPDFYANRQSDGFYSKRARSGFEVSVDTVSDNEGIPRGYGYPNCKEWWLGANTRTPYVTHEALTTRLYDELTPYLKEHHRAIYLRAERLLSDEFSSGSSYHGYYTVKDAVLHEALFKPDKLNALAQNSSVDYGLDSGDTNVLDWTFRALGSLGLIAKSVPQFSGASMLQLAMPMVKPFIILVIILAYLPAMMVGRLRWKYIGLFHGVVISLIFWPFFWELARLIDDTLLDAMGIAWSDINTQIFSQWIASSMYLYGPLIFSTALGWVGMAGADSAFSKMSGQAGSAGQSGGSTATSSGKSLGKRGGKAVIGKATGGKIGSG